MSYCDNCANYNPQTCSALVRQACDQGASCGSYKSIMDGNDNVENETRSYICSVCQEEDVAPLNYCRNCGELIEHY